MGLVSSQDLLVLGGYALVKPTINFSDVIQAAIDKSILCPACKWSNVPPSAVTGYIVGRLFPACAFVSVTESIGESRSSTDMYEVLKRPMTSGSGTGMASKRT